MPNFNSTVVRNKGRKKNALKYKTANDFKRPSEAKVLYEITDCCEFLKKIPDGSIQLICIDPPYNLGVADWDNYDNYIEWASEWLCEAYRVLADDGNLVIFGGIQFRETSSGDLLDLIQYIRNHMDFILINTIVWYYKNGISSRRFFSSRHEEIIWLSKSNEYYFDLDAVRIPYLEEQLNMALKDKRLNKDNIYKGKNPTNVWEIARLNGNSKERVGHKTQKPLAIIERLIKALSYPGAYVLDFFAGSGTTGVACIQEGRHCLMCDNDLKSIEYFHKHLSKNTGKFRYKYINQVTDFFNR